MTGYTRPLPPPDAQNRPHWEAARRGVLLLWQCGQCGKRQFPAMRRCPACQSAEGGWVQSSGKGTVESFCTFHKAYWAGFADAIPYDVIQVRLDDDVRLYSNIHGMNGQPLTIGMRVEPYFDTVTPELTLIKFKPTPKDT
jgi:uncharacterized OB-fold protein